MENSLGEIIFKKYPRQCALLLSKFALNWHVLRSQVNISKIKGRHKLRSKFASNLDSPNYKRDPWNNTMKEDLQIPCTINFLMKFQIACHKTHSWHEQQWRGATNLLTRWNKIRGTQRSVWFPCYWFDVVFGGRGTVGPTSRFAFMWGRSWYLCRSRSSTSLRMRK